MSSKSIQNNLNKIVNIKNFPKYVCNRNPRNLEKLCIAYKPDGWHLEKPGRTYWHKLFVERTARVATAYIKHYTGHIPVQASTKEWAIRKHLYSATDISAYVNLARVFGMRCVQCGITEMYSDLQPTDDQDPENSKLQLFINELAKTGVTLSEPKRYIHPRPSDPFRPDKPWECFKE